ncbi:cation-dependent phenylpropanoid and flavonoid 8-O-methyltransferase 1-like [Primulina huaijiensis]|uniref:cation-dependent phenylpropanoid and flavonoid 8-O-methyltransferase 1-like n=1 Tax=Primulina huaijiensis TaxID=1492673 RepID=UPI003CC6EF8A
MENHEKYIHPGLLQTLDLYQYLVKTSVFPREPDSLKEIRTMTSTLPTAYLGSSPDAGQLMALLLKLINPKKTIELGVFTGYSLLLTALNIPEDGKIIAIDPDRSAYEMGLPVIQKAGVEHKIDYIESEAHPVLDKLLQDPLNHEAFDFAYVDADKINYKYYHEKLLKLLKPGAIVIYDNTLWGGTLAMAEDSVPENMVEVRKFAIEFNEILAADTRVQISHVPAGDGFTICRCL